VGNAKRAASFEVRAWIPGQLWAKKTGLEPIRDIGHQRRAFPYIVQHREQQGWVWTFRDPIPRW